jgi:hypothetical protein
MAVGGVDMDETHGTVATPFVVPAFAMVNIGMGLVLLIRSAYFLSSNTSDATVGVLAAVGLVELITGLGLAAQLRWAWVATRVLIPVNLAIAVALWIMASAGPMLIPVVLYAACAALLYIPGPRLGDLHQQIREWTATRWAKGPEQRPSELSSTARDERPMAA